MTIIWVAKTGSDITGSGTETNPYLTINKAVSVFVDGDQIRICDGEYNETDAIVLDGVNGSIIAASGKTYDANDIDPAVLIKPTAMASSNGVIYIANSTRFEIKGLTIEQCSTSASNQFGIKLESVSNVYIQNCVVRNFDCTGSSYCVGIYGDSSTYGKVEDCIVDNLSCDGTLVGGIIGNVNNNFDCLNCRVGEIDGIIGTSTCVSYGITNLQVLDPKLYTLIFGWNQLDASTFEYYDAIYEKNHDTFTEHLNNEIGLTIVTNPIDCWIRTDPYPILPKDPSSGNPIPGHTIWAQGNKANQQATYVTDNGGVTHVYLLYQTHLADGVLSRELVKIRHWRSDTGIWSDEVLPSYPVSIPTPLRIKRGCIKALNINGTIHIVATACGYAASIISGIPYFCNASCAYFLTYIYNGSSWSVTEDHSGYTNMHKPLNDQYNISLFVDGSNLPVAYLSYVHGYTGPGREFILLKLNFVTGYWGGVSTWDAAHIIRDNTGGYPTMGYTMTNVVGTYNNLYCFCSTVYQQGYTYLRQQSYFAHCTDGIGLTWTWTVFSPPNKTDINLPPSPANQLMPVYAHYISDSNIMCLAQNVPFIGAGASCQNSNHLMYFGHFLQWNGASWNDRTDELAAFPGYDAVKARMNWRFTGIHYYDENFYILTSQSPYIYIYRDGVWSYKSLNVESGSDADPATWYNAKGHSVAFVYVP